MFKKILNPVTIIFMKHIHIIEDDNEIRTLLKDYLNKNSYITSEAADGNTGLSLILNENYDLILLDLMLPGISGENLLKELRSSGKTTPVIVISAKKNFGFLSFRTLMYSKKSLPRASFMPRSEPASDHD